jgi:hypothetical protein
MSRICVAVDEGQSCTLRALPGQQFCSGHHPRAFEYRRCAYFTRLGRQCASLALRGQDHCFTHSPRNHRARRPAMPIIPRTQRQKAYARRHAFMYMPQPKTELPEIPWGQ